MNQRVLYQNEIILNEASDYYLLQGECPYCHGLFAVDLTFIDQVDTTVSCPMCLGRVVFEEDEEEGKDN